MLWLKLILFSLFLLTQYQWWFGINGLQDWQNNKQMVERWQKVIQERDKRNQILLADVQDLKQGHEGVEERARNELGMIKNNETFIRIIKKGR